ncbi:MAG: hypothetical protein KDB29_15800 [Planctomycetes bacterium]|nr:hypothetical protein [Planctomycetota bacterium]
MTAIRKYLMGAGLVSLGFVLGWAMPTDDVKAQRTPSAPKPVAPEPKVKPKDLEKPKDPWARDDGLPSFDYQQYKSLVKYPSSMDWELLTRDVPGLPEDATKEEFSAYPFIDVVHFQPGKYDTVKAAGVIVTDVEQFHFLRLDDLDVRMGAECEKMRKFADDWAAHAQDDDRYWGDCFTGVALLPPMDRDGRGAEYTWEVKRHPNGRVKSVTPYIGETEKNIHGIQLEYNEEGMLISLTPWVDGKRHGVQKLFDGNSRSRLQEAASTKSWVNGVQVVEKAGLVKPKLPPIKQPKK